MTFNETISQLQYSIKEHSENYISIGFDDKPSSIIILFDLKNKLLTGSLIPTREIKNLNDITHQYALFNKMQSDLKQFEELSKYRRV